jgi:hypothetical protein
LFVLNRPQSLTAAANSIAHSSLEDASRGGDSCSLSGNCCPLVSNWKVSLPIAVLMIGGLIWLTPTSAPPSLIPPVTQLAMPNAPDIEEPRLLRHVVLFQFKPEATPEQIEAIVTEFGQLPSKIAEIADYEYGLNNSPEGLSEGLTHCFLVTFRSEQDRDAYLPHPAHLEFVQILRPHLAKAVVVDYWAGK